MVNMMGVKESELNTANVQPSLNDSPARESGLGNRAYNEIPGIRHETKDVLKQLDANLRTLEDLGGRLGYVLSEVRGLIRR